MVLSRPDAVSITMRYYREPTTLQQRIWAVALAVGIKPKPIKTWEAFLSLPPRDPRYFDDLLPPPNPPLP